MKHKTIFMWLSSLVLICLIVTFLSYTRKSANDAILYSDGKVLERISLNSVTEPYEISVNKGDKHNIILVENGKISMKYANCPDGLCVSQGAITSSIYPIVCLPNDVIIKIDGGYFDNEEVDAITR